MSVELFGLGYVNATAIKTLKFKDDMFSRILNGNKNTTRRLPKKHKVDFSPGDFVIACDEAGNIRKVRSRNKKSGFSDNCAILKVLKVRKENLKNINHDEAIREGFLNLPDFVNYWNGIYCFDDAFEANPEVIVIEFCFDRNLNCSSTEELCKYLKREELHVFVERYAPTKS